MNTKNTFIATVTDIRFTHGGFGEQYWSLTQEDGTKRVLAMWMDLTDPLWARVGEKVLVREDGEFKVNTGGGGYISIKSTGTIVEKIA